MKNSAGIAIVWKDKVFLVHPTNNKWWGTYSIPKGQIENDENVTEAAVRELKEEVGIELPISSVRENELFECEYPKSNKKVLYYVYKIKDLKEIGLENEIQSRKNLQLEEVDWAGFVTFEEALKRIHPNMRPIIENIQIEFT